ncbi:MAG: cobaltochelatase CobT, partial [Hyphomicrobiales bacterium]
MTPPPATNSKPRSGSKESPAEPFKRAVSGCMRALARQPELEVTFAAERPGIAGGKARLPEPPRKLNAQDVAIVRGHADSMALKLACHDPVVHRRRMPGGQQARAVFEAVEQARVEAIGARRMQGVAQNLSAMLDDKFHRGKFDAITDRADAPVEDAVAMMVRERLTGLAPPPAARKLVDLWRPFIEERAGADLDRLEQMVENQRRFGDVVLDLLDSLEMGDERSRDSEENEDEQGENEDSQNQGEDGESKESEDAQGMSQEEMEVSAEELPDGASEALDAPSADMPEDADMGDSEASNEPWRPRQHGANEPRGPDYKPFIA